MALTTNAICASKLFPREATVSQLCDELRGRKVSPFVGSEAACTSLTIGAAENKMDLAFVFATRSVAARNDMVSRVEGALSMLNLAYLPSRAQGFPRATEPKKELATLDEP